jgi:hypothetical protein
VVKPFFGLEKGPQLKIKIISRIEETGTLAVKKPFLICRGKTFFWAGKTARPVNTGI